MRRALLLILALLPVLAAAQGYPSKPIRFVVPYPPGGPLDLMARAIGAGLTEAWGQPVVVDNRIGVVGAESAARATPDGYTIMFTRCVS